ncbi:MazG nucleotide pyrophosphohydrolase domain-containing protein [Proteus mirabilis]|uniref:MazG nucleotide pyrophosphohydrolase domain-containing protein n=1 Tax=Proteus mirabilis TaxID=584 RepID=UPI00162A1DD3|nr:MazG nucleotide pyrophosphohydrolase domain-containing protein [Proteus mirabilis]EKU2369658.1 nucleotide pyrophosphohydrolase [Proteus mirabilis]EKU7917587.1 nucleotide pyrophosphohydrolase [Proteus mirabilis]EKU7921714.1 nucleotide pyrophosphohydrolase [Proteus mirabilis]EKU8688630.1 nucleotide pyrophosphohydrolase [Proteus mirabilis]EKU8703460.1 nucleotide pyrophosphohydrolase [Proteus mirabilis]
MSLTLKEICEKQKAFDKKTFIREKPFYTDINENNLQELEHLIVCLVGELGEFSNLTKKIVRGDKLFHEEKINLDEELVDIFIYLIKISNQFDVDLEEGFLKKLEKNQERFGN